MSRTGKGPYRFVREFAWGHLFTVIGHLVRAILLFLTALGVLIAAVTFVVQLEDRQGEQTYRAWQVVREYENRQGASGAPLRDALQFINREFGGALCWAPVNRFPQWLTGNPRQCLFPRKNREKLQARQVDLAGIDLAGADLTGADLTDATLRNVSLIRAELVRADLAGADLTGAKLRASEFTFRGRDRPSRNTVWCFHSRRPISRRPSGMVTSHVQTSRRSSWRISEARAPTSPEPTSPEPTSPEPTS